MLTGISTPTARATVATSAMAVRSSGAASVSVATTREPRVDGRHLNQVWHRRPSASESVVCSLSMDPGWSYLRTLECTACGDEFDAATVHGVCPKCSKVLFARYDLAALRGTKTPDDFLRRGWDMWRYHELLPVHDPPNVVTLGEGMTPLLRLSERGAPRLGFSGGRLRIKDEGKNPTGSFKARGMAAAISRAKELGITEVALASAGNAGSAATAYASAAGITAQITLPRDV